MVRPAPFKVLSLLLSTGLFVSSLAARAHPLDNWHNRYTAPSGQSFLSVTASADLFVAVGNQGRVATSPDGVTWTPQTSGTAARLIGSAWGAGTFVAVGDGGTILSSPNGTNWTARVSGVTARLHSVRFGNGLFLTAGESFTLLTSPNGADWAVQSPGLTFFPYFIACGNGLFLLEGTAPANVLSADGTNWFQRPSGSTGGLYTAGFGKGMFLAIDIGNHVLTSTDASNWTQRGSVTVFRPSALVYGNGEFVVCGDGPPEYSETGVQWTATPTNLFCTSGGFGQGTFVLAAGSGLWQSDPVVRLQAPSLGALALEGPVGRAYRIETIDGLAPTNQWQALTNITLTTSPQPWTDPAPPAAASRFYRAVLLE